MRPAKYEVQTWNGNAWERYADAQTEHYARIEARVARFAGYRVRVVELQTGRVIP